jgi:DNA-binding MarR family transcriptional regulator
MPNARKTPQAKSAPFQDEPYILERQVGHLMRRANQRHVSLFMEMIGDDSLTPTQYAALVKIGDAGEVSQNLLGRLTAMDPATSQGVIRRLLDRKLISRQPDPLDARKVVLSLTPKGAALREQSIARARRVTAATLAPLTAEEQTVLLQLLAKLS